MSSFTEKRLRVTLILAGANAVFPGTNSNTLVLENMRMTASVRGVARLSTHLDMNIYGMRQVDMNALSVMWAIPTSIQNNLVILEANNGGATDGWVQVFKGTLKEAQPDYRAMPDVSFTLLATTNYFQQINPVPPISYPEATTIGVIAADIVALMGDPWTLTLAEGLEGTIANPYFCGTLWDQLSKACEAVKCDFYMQGDEVLLTPRGQPRSSIPALLLNAGSGLIGYPMYSQAGLEVTALFNGAFLCGTAIDLESVVPNVTGRWFPYTLQHTLESRTPHGAWVTQMVCLKVIV